MISSKVQVYLNVPFKEKDQAKALGSVDVWFADRVCADFGLKQGERRVA